LQNETAGYPGLLNFGASRHRTIFIFDFTLPEHTKEKIVAGLAETATQVCFLHPRDVMSDIHADTLTRLGIDASRDYLSIHLLTSDPQVYKQAMEFVATLRHWDFARIEFPMTGRPLHADQVNHLINVVNDADYGEQDKLCELFYAALDENPEYTVNIDTAAGTMVINDTQAWFQLAGRLQQGEKRILPGGEVAYTGNRVNGVFTIDGGMLAIPQWPEGEEHAKKIQVLSSALEADPLNVEIEEGVIKHFWSGKEDSATLFETLFPDDHYHLLTEVGISFNRACKAFIHDWPAASNEGRPGVHIGIGGDPDPKDRTHSFRDLVHVDLMSANCSVTVNTQNFLKTSS